MQRAAIMNRTSKRRLALSTTTLRSLSGTRLAEVAGGLQDTRGVCGSRVLTCGCPDTSKDSDCRISGCNGCVTEPGWGCKLQ